MGGAAAALQSQHTCHVTRRCPILSVVYPVVSDTETGCAPYLCGVDTVRDTDCMLLGGGFCDGVVLSPGVGYCSPGCHGWTGDSYITDDGVNPRDAFCADDSPYMCTPCRRKRRLLFATTPDETHCCA